MSRNSTNHPALSLVLLVLLSACHTREVGDVPAEKGAIFFSDDFERAVLGKDWSRGAGEGGSGKWQIKDGWVHGSGLKNDPLWLGKTLPESTRVEFDVKALTPTGDIKVEVFGDGKNHASGYVLIFGGWDNTLDVIARLDEHGDDRLARASRKVETNRVYSMAVERTDALVKWFVDGSLFMTYRDPKPLRGEDHAHFAFSNWQADVAFDNVKVYRLR